MRAWLKGTARSVAEVAGEGEAQLRPEQKAALDLEVEKRLAGRAARPAALGIAEKTVQVHRGRGMAKLGVRSGAELARLLERLGKAR